MKKLVFAALTAVILALSVSAFAQSYGFEDSLDGLVTVNNSLGAGGEAVYGEGFIGKGLVLNSGYGLELGEVGPVFSVSAMVNISSSGGTQTVFFKNMGSVSSENWTSIVLSDGVPKFWTSGWNWKDSDASNCLNRWIHLVYTENNGTGVLYVDGKQVSTGSVNSVGGTLYLGATYWTADAPSGTVDELEVFDRCLTGDEVNDILDNQFRPHLFEHYSFPMRSLANDLDLSAVPGGDSIVWTSDNEAVLSSTGVVNRQAENVTVTLTGVLGNVTRKFTFVVLGIPAQVNDRMILSYKFGENAAVQEFEGAEAGFTDYAADLSGNGNHGTVYGGMTGGYFDGADDYVQLPKGILKGHDSFTILMRLTPEIISTHQFTFCIGNNTTEYFFLNTSRPSPDSNTLRLAITNSGSNGEKCLIHTPGLRSGESAVLTITANSTQYKMYLNGIPVASGDLELSVSSLGDTSFNYLAKSPYNDSLYKGRIDEFTVYSYAMDEEEVYDSFHTEPEFSDGRYISGVEMAEKLRVELYRDCITAVSFYDADGRLLNATTKKVSNDKLVAEFDAGEAVSAEIAAFDAATGIVRDKVLFSASGEIVAYTQNGGSVKIENSSYEDASVVVMLATYEDGRLKALDLKNETVAAGSFEVIPVKVGEGARLLVWKSLNSMMPVQEKK